MSIEERQKQTTVNVQEKAYLGADKVSSVDMGYSYGIGGFARNDS